MVVAQVVEEERVDLAQGERHLERSRRHHGLDVGVQVGGRHAEIGIAQAVEGPGDVAGRQRAAVVEGHALAKLERVATARLVDRPGGGQARVHTVVDVDVDVDQVIVDGVDDRDLRIRRGEGGVEAHGRLERHAQGTLLGVREAAQRQADGRDRRRQQANDEPDAGRERRSQLGGAGLARGHGTLRGGGGPRSAARPQPTPVVGSVSRPTEDTSRSPAGTATARWFSGGANGQDQRGS